jgi:hypothetical protein
LVHDVLGLFVVQRVKAALCAPLLALPPPQDLESQLSAMRAALAEESSRAQRAGGWVGVARVVVQRAQGAVREWRALATESRNAAHTPVLIAA